MTHPYLDTDEGTVTAAQHEAAVRLQTVYVALAAAKPYVAYAASLISDNEKLSERVLDAGHLEDDYSDVMALVRDVIEACGAKVPV